MKPWRWLISLWERTCLWTARSTINGQPSAGTLLAPPAASESRPRPWSHSSWAVEPWLKMVQACLSWAWPFPPRNILRQAVFAPNNPVGGSCLVRSACLPSSRFLLLSFYNCQVYMVVTGFPCSVLLLLPFIFQSHYPYPKKLLHFCLSTLSWRTQPTHTLLGFYALYKDNSLFWEHLFPPSPHSPLPNVAFIIWLCPEFTGCVGRMWSCLGLEKCTVLSGRTGNMDSHQEDAALWWMSHYGGTERSDHLQRCPRGESTGFGVCCKIRFMDWATRCQVTLFVFYLLLYIQCLGEGRSSSFTY